MDVNCAVYLLQMSSTQKWKNLPLKQCSFSIFAVAADKKKMRLTLKLYSIIKYHDLSYVDTKLYSTFIFCDSLKKN